MCLGSAWSADCTNEAFAICRNDSAPLVMMLNKFGEALKEQKEGQHFISFGSV